MAQTTEIEAKKNALGNGGMESGIKASGTIGCMIQYSCEYISIYWIDNTHIYVYIYFHNTYLVFYIIQYMFLTIDVDK